MTPQRLTLQAASSEPAIFLLGFMGSGKSTLGKKMAQKLGFDFIDLDEQIVQEIGMSITDYFEQFGEASFREIEQKMLHRLGNKTDLIIATGGGTPCHFDNMEWMNAHGQTVYIQLAPKALLARLSQKETETRPLLKGKNAEELFTFITEKLAERTSFYEKATIIYDAMNTKPVDLLNALHKKTMD